MESVGGEDLTEGTEGRVRHRVLSQGASRDERRPAVIPRHTCRSQRQTTISIFRRLQVRSDAVCTLCTQNGVPPSVGVHSADVTISGCVYEVE